MIFLCPKFKLSIPLLSLACISKQTKKPQQNLPAHDDAQIAAPTIRK
jgi:hypothetical protein